MKIKVSEEPSSLEGNLFDHLDCDVICKTISTEFLRCYTDRLKDDPKEGTLTIGPKSDDDYECLIEHFYCKDHQVFFDLEDEIYEWG